MWGLDWGVLTLTGKPKKKITYSFKLKKEREKIKKILEVLNE